MTPKQKIELRASENRTEVRAILAKEDKTTEDHERLKELTQTAEDLEVELRAALAVEPEPESVTTTATDGADVELRALRDRCSVNAFLLAGMGRRKLDGPELEYRTEVGAEPGSIPYDLFEGEDDGVETRADVVTGPPSTTGRNFAGGVVPKVLAASVAGSLGCAMPRVGSGTYAVPRMTTNPTASMRAPGAAQEAASANFDVITASPKRASARIGFRAEDLAAVGIPAFESATRSALRRVLGWLVDQQILRGSGATNNVNGLISQLTAPANDTATITFSSWASKVSGLVDGTWAPMLSSLRILTNDTAYAKLSSTFADNEDATTALNWSSSAGVNVSVSGQMAPDASGGHSTALAFRAGGGMDVPSAASMPSCLPVWGSISIDDIFSSAASAEQWVTLHVLLGSRVIIKQPDAYSLLKLKTS